MRDEQLEELIRAIRHELSRRDQHIQQIVKALDFAIKTIQKQEIEIKDLQESVSDLYLTGTETNTNNEREE